MGFLATLNLPIDKLETYPGNPRKGDVEVIAESLLTNEQYRAVVVQAADPDRPENGGTVLAGNHTFIAAQQLGWSTIRAELHNVNDERARRIVLVDNRSADLGSYDERILAELLAEQEDLTGTGYTSEDIASLEAKLAEEEEVEFPELSNDPDDDSPTPPEDPHCQIGDVWRLGKHWLVVGDSTDPNTWDKLLGENKADMVWTDPPYGFSYTGRTRDSLKIKNDSLEGDDLGEFLRGSLGLALGFSKPGACWYVASPSSPNMNQFGIVLEELGVYRQLLIWVKDHFTLSHLDYHPRHEIIFYGWKPGAAHHAVPDRMQDTIHEIPRPSRSSDHPTMKPVELISRHIRNNSNPGDLVVDPFGGSGSTLLAAHSTGREAALIELDPRYADAICRRYQRHSGDLPTRDGEPHDFAGNESGNA